MAHLVYAVGDIHGSAHLLALAVDRIRRHAGSHSFDVVFLGDYIDRGRDACGTVQYLIDLSLSISMICLKGNHEEMFVRAHRERTDEELEFWLEHGGLATVLSYQPTGAPKYATDHIPEPHRRWLASLPLHYETNTHVFVHAGLHPGRVLMDQAQHDLLWIRRKFLAAPAKSFAETRHVVHGHTTRWRGKPDPAMPELLPHRTNLDTGAYKTGLLTVGCFPEGRRGGPTDLISVL